jgi:hypothetical protein
MSIHRVPLCLCPFFHFSWSLDFLVFPRPVRPRSISTFYVLDFFFHAQFVLRCCSPVLLPLLPHFRRSYLSQTGIAFVFIVITLIAQNYRHVCYLLEDQVICVNFAKWSASRNKTVLGAFLNLRKVTIASSCLSVVRMYQFGSHWKVFGEILYCFFF